ncbi:hypothetical protein BURK2_03018 [Burkholderiales bacterium]|nr:hypothetical protein BURK2_03018 [Burkholderiales bacterium]
MNDDTTDTQRRDFLAQGAALTLLALATPALAQSPAMESKKMSDTVQAAFKEMIDWSLKEKRGLTFYVNGQTLGGGVVRWIGNEAVELKSQQFSKIVLRLDRVDGIAQ